MKRKDKLLKVSETPDTLYKSKKENIIGLILMGLTILFSGILLGILLGMCISTIHASNNFEQKLESIPKIKETEINNTEVEFILPRTSHQSVMELLMNRNGKLIIEICEGKVLDNDGNGESIYEDKNYYIHYNPEEYKQGDEVLSIFVYDPNTNAEDAITQRVDFKKNGGN